MDIKRYDKLFSGRFIAFVSVVLTYCFIVNYVVIKYVSAIVGSPEKIEAFATGLLTGFSGTAMYLFKAYFDRGDRVERNQSNNKT